MKQLCIEYEHHLASFLDEKGIKWSAGSGKLHDIICIYLPNHNPKYVWNLKAEFEEWKKMYCSNY